MKKLAIIGHPEKGKEVIDILKMLGGNNKNGWECKNSQLAYYIDNNTGLIEFINDCNPNENILRYTLKEFLEKYPYKIGDMIRVPEFESEVRINDMKWDGYNIQYEVFTDETEWYSAEELNNWNTKNLKKGPEYKIGEKVIYDGDVVEITENHRNIDQHTSYFYHNGTLKSSSFEEPKKINQNPILQQLKKYFEETPREIVEKEWNELSYLNDIGPTVEEYLESVKKYRQTQYPKTYKECCKVLGCKANDFFTDFSYNGCDVEISEYEDKVDDLLQNFRKLRYARDAYWKIAGEQMGLDKPWEPDWNDDKQGRYIIMVYENKLYKDISIVGTNFILVFPTEEMRDAFYENFKDLIEECKELL